MKKINLYELYEFGKYMAPLASLGSSDKLGPNVFKLVMARLRLKQFTEHGTPLLSSSVRAVNAMVSVIDRVVDPDLEKAFEVEADATIGWHANTLQNALKTLESVFSNDMPDIASYVVSQKGIYRTDDLIAHAENQLSEDVRKILPSQACQDIREAGKCLAYELPTACAFHLWRSVETVMGLYYERLTGVTLEAAGIARNWGAYITAMNKANAESKITVFLDHIRDEYRNPQTHPDEKVSIDEAQRLFSVALSSIEQMILATNKLPLSAIAAATFPPFASPALLGVKQ